MVRIVYKGDLERIKLFQANNIKGPFEVSYRGAQDYGRRVADAVAVHFHSALPDGRRIDLADSGEIGDLSQRELRQAIEFARENNIPKLVFHPPSVNIFKTTKELALNILAARLQKEYDPKVLLCIENVCLWINLMYTNEPLFADPEDFFQIRRAMKTPLGLVFDVEHFCVTAVMKLFYEQLKQDFVNIELGRTEYHAVRHNFEENLKQYQRTNNLHRQCHDFLKRAIRLLKDDVSYLHCCGSDFNQYYYNAATGLPLIGEHIPLGYDGLAGNIPVKDRLDHWQWTHEIKDKNWDIVMEVSPKEGYNLIEQTHKSKELIENILHRAK